MSSNHEHRLAINRRQVVGGLAALLACPLSRRSFAETRPLRFGVFSLFEPRDLIVQSSEPLLLISSEATEERSLLPASTPAVIRWTGPQRMTVIGVPMSSLWVVSPAQSAARFVLAVPPSSRHGSIRREFQGSLAVAATHDRLQPVVSMEIETAVASIVAAEGPAVAPLAYLMAQAVASRSFLLASEAGHIGFDFCDTTHCQFLRGPAPLGSAAHIAAARTLGLSLHFEGRPIAAMYSRSCPGKTRSMAEIGLLAHGYPYYSVTCDYCLRHPETWERDRPAQDLPHNELQRLAFTRIHGWAALPSSSFIATKDALIGQGIGHGVGMCQRGAAAMATQGATWQEILAHYYPNTIIGT
jgi:stage II sporulation protein D